jgi:hypothetical protein
VEVVRQRVHNRHPGVLRHLFESRLGVGAPHDGGDLALEDATLRDKLVAYRAAQTARVLGESLDGDAPARPER